MKEVEEHKGHGGRREKGGESWVRGLMEEGDRVEASGFRGFEELMLEGRYP